MGEKGLTLESRVGDLYRTPVGHDALAKVLLQLGIPEWAVTNGVVSGLKLKTLAGMTKKMLGSDFFDAVLKLVNTEPDVPVASKGAITPKWWKEAVFYQIYPRSFYDTNGDGIGDLRGIIEKLDYLKELGVDALWLSPIYDSPNDDNGYDIRDYHKIMEEFGTMEDFDELLEKIHAKGMRLIMDLVINHTSDEHEWFKKALEDPNSEYRDYYYFRKDDGSRKEPNNWVSFFSGPAWNYYEESDSWALHLFSKKQMDLNWENPKVRDELVKMINWWLDKGVDGFRMDVINYISKEPGLPDGNEAIGNLMGFPGIEKYYYGPRLHEFFREVQARAFAPHDAFSVGETPGIGMKMCQLVTGEERKELDMVFSFDHLETPGHVRMDDYEYDLNYYRDYMIDWMENYGNNCWMSIFYNNHDNPRMISKVTNDKVYHNQLAKLLAVMQFTLKGTPFVFQGDEMGLANYDFTSMDQLTDVEAKGYYAEHTAKNRPADEVFKELLAGTREHCRVLLPWNEKLPEYHAGLEQEIKEDVRDAYKTLIALRKDNEMLIYGDFEVINRKKNRFVYCRKSGDKEYIIDCNLSKDAQQAYKPSAGYEMIFPSVLSSGTTSFQLEVLGAYEARIWVKG